MKWTCRRAELALQYGETRIAVTSDSADSIIWLAEFMTPQFEITRRGSADCTIQLVIDPVYHTLLERRRRASAGREVDCFTLDGRFATGIAFNESPVGRWVYDSKHDAYFQVNRAASDVQIVARGDARHTRFALMRVVREIATIGQFHGNRLPVHGAAFQSGSRCVVVVGPKRTGKTTFLMWAASHGRPLIANDRLFLDLSPCEAMVRGMPTVVKIRPGSFNFFPGLTGSLEASCFCWHRTITECGAEHVPVVEAAGGSRAPGLSGRQLCETLGVDGLAESPLGSIVFPVVAPQVTGIELRPLSHAEAAARLARGLLKPGQRQSVSEVFGGPAAGAEVSADTESRQCRELAFRVPSFECALGRGAYDAPFPREVAEWEDDLPAKDIA